MAPLKILISGPGIAGNALAFWLSKLGHEVTVVERFPGLRINGLQLDLRGHGIEVLKLMGLEQAFQSHAAPETGLQMVDTTGKRWAYFPANKSGSFTSDYEIMRGDLCQIIYDATKARTRYVFGTSIEGFKEKDGKLEVRFSDAEINHFDLLVGADGQNSRTRRMMLGKDVPDPFYPLDDCIAYFTIDRPVQEQEEYVATMYIAPGPRFVMTRRHNPHKMQVYLLGKDISGKLHNVQRGDVEGEKAALTENFQNAGWQVGRILESMLGADDFYCERPGLVKMSCWSEGRVTLVGDAAYSPTAVSGGMGTTSAIVGAYVLAGEIGKRFRKAADAKEDIQNNLAAALKSYEDIFRPFMVQVQKGVGEPSFLDKVPWTPFTVVILNWVLWFAMLLRLDLIAGAFNKESMNGWNLPKYEAMLGE